jgi:hypothetical protein
MQSATTLIILLTITLAGCSGGGSPSGQSRGRAPAPDPALRVVLAVVALERDPASALTDAQAAKILPWLRVLRDMRPEDVEAAQTIADEVLALLTSGQRSVLQRLQEENRERRGAPGGQGAGLPGARPPAGDGSGPGPAGRTEFRRRLIERAIRLLEAKVPAPSP